MEQCIKHPEITLQTYNVKSKSFILEKTIYYDVVYCPECFEEHARTGKTMCMDINKREDLWKKQHSKRI